MLKNALAKSFARPMLKALRPALMAGSAFSLLSWSGGLAAQSVVPATPAPIDVAVDWAPTGVISKTEPTLQIVVNPKMLPGQVVEKTAYAAVRALGAKHVRFVPWFPYPQLSVAELDAPTATATSWNFKLIDPQTKAFLEATKGQSPIVNFSTIPAWMFKTDKPVVYPADPMATMFTYVQGTELRDTSGREMGDYFARLVSWYAKGGFTDENGKRHESGYHYDIPLWEVLNEPEFEHATTPQDYVKRYDAMTAAIQKVSPTTKFVGVAIASPGYKPEYFEYFLNPANHRPGAPLDWISYHFYAYPSRSETIDQWQYSFFHQAEGFLDTVRYIEQVRKRLAPHVKTTIDETGIILPSDFISNEKVDTSDPNFPAGYWNLSGALYAFLFMEVSKIGIDALGASQLVGYPSQFPSVTMVDWNTGAPNPRFRVLELLKRNMAPGDRIPAPTLRTGAGDEIYWQGYEHGGRKQILLVNRRRAAGAVLLPADAVGGDIEIVDQQSGSSPARVERVRDRTVALGGFAVAVVRYPVAAK